MTDELVVELFAGPGGSSTGLRAAGYTGRAIGIEWDLPACRTATVAGHERICADVATYPPERFAGADGLIASPPCQSFSRAGNRKGLNDARGELVWEPLRWARVLRPRWIACEQVPDVLPIWRQTAHELRALGYSAWTGVLCAADYGVPQTRERAFLIARRDGRPALPPEPTHSQEGGDGLFGAVLRWVSMAEALGWGLPLDPSPVVMTARGRQAGPQDVLRGSSWRHEWFQRQIADGNQPAPTIYCSRPGNLTWVYRNGNQEHSAKRPLTEPAPTVHFAERSNKVEWMPVELADEPSASGVRVTVQQAATLQGFAADYPWQGTKTQQYQQVGNCVPPPLAEAILRPLLASATGERAA